MICNNTYLADILRVCEIKDLILVMRFQSPLVYFNQQPFLVNKSYSKVVKTVRMEDLIGHTFEFSLFIAGGI